MRLPCCKRLFVNSSLPRARLVLISPLKPHRLRFAFPLTRTNWSASRQIYSPTPCATHAIASFCGHAPLGIGLNWKWRTTVRVFRKIPYPCLHIVKRMDSACEKCSISPLCTAARCAPDATMATQSFGSRSRCVEICRTNPKKMHSFNESRLENPAHCAYTKIQFHTI